MKSLLILNNRRDHYSNLMWKIAINKGWNTFRMVCSDNLAEVSKDYDIVRFYADTLTGNNLINPPFKFHIIPNDILESIHIKFPEFTGRSIKATTLEHLPPITEPTFIKPARDKFFEAKVYNIGESPINEHCKPTDPIYIQSIINPITEIRCFVLNGRILTASYYKKNATFETEFIENPPSQVQDQVQKICQHCNIPWGIVLDFYQTPNNNNWFFLEANEAWASGLYDNDPNQCFNCIINSQYDTMFNTNDLVNLVCQPHPITNPIPFIPLGDYPSGTVFYTNLIP